MGHWAASAPTDLIRCDAPPTIRRDCPVRGQRGTGGIWRRNEAPGYEAVGRCAGRGPTNVLGLESPVLSTAT
jgi:hypothetical protein